MRSTAATRKWPGTHRNVGHAEVEERLGGPAVVELVEPGQVVGNRRFQGVVEQMFNGKTLGVVAARGLARAAGVVKIDLSLAHVRCLLARRNKEFGLVHNQVFVSDGEFTHQETLVDGAELAHAQTAKIDRPKALGRRVHQQVA